MDWLGDFSCFSNFEFCFHAAWCSSEVDEVNEHLRSFGTSGLGSSKTHQDTLELGSQGILRRLSDQVSSLESRNMRWLCEKELTKESEAIEDMLLNFKSIPYIPGISQAGCPQC